jgi:DNA-binding transcriptional regulator GbsR (MarR family)
MTSEEDRRRFAEDVSLAFESMHFPPMAGRVWAALLVSDQPQLSAADLQEQIGASAGSISMAIATLNQLGIIQRVWIPGDRRSYYAAPTSTLDRLLRRRAESLTQMVQLAERGVETFADVDLAAERLTYLRDLYAWFDREYDILLERWRDEQQTS